MQVARNTVVAIEYELFDPDGELIEKSAEPLVYLHGGYAGIFGPVEEALEGRDTGETVRVKLQPEDAFGDYDESLINIEPRSLFPDNIEVGMQFERVAEDGDDGALYTITDIVDDKVVVDGNHPLAGTALVFSCTVRSVRQATAEEVSHGHVHGPHGHHHH